MIKEEQTMSLPVQKAVFNLVTTILLMGGYLSYIFVINGDVNISKMEVFQFWGSFILKMTGVMVVSKIILFISFSIFRTIKKGHKVDETLDFMDERDKLIEMKSDRYSHWIFMIGFIGSMIPVATGYPVQYMFITLLSFGLLAGLMSDVWKIYFYNKGV